jgi:hypothetical protein
MYSENQIVNDIVLTIINDGDGSMCGMDYKARLDAGRHHGLFEFRHAAREYGRYRHKHFGSSVPTRHEWVEAGNILMRYYEEHAKECE